MDQYLHNKGTDKLIADVRAYQPANMAEQDEVPEAFDEFTGPCDMQPYPPPSNPDGSIESRPYGWVSRHVDIAHTIGFQSGIVAAINAVYDSHISLGDKQRLAETLAKIGPTVSTR